MKRCPQCQNLFDDDNSFCQNDGTPLISDLAETMVFTPPPTVQQKTGFVVDLSPPPPEIPTQFTPVPPVSRVQTPPKTSNNFIVPLLIGLLFGGVAVAAIYLFINKSDGNETASAVISNSSNSSNNSAENKESKNTSKKESVSNTGNSNIASNANKPREDDKFNGRVIMLNAYLRSAPDRYSAEISILPMDDRLNIKRREHSGSPWYYVTCEHGETGWIHGNTIEYMR